MTREWEEPIGPDVNLTPPVDKSKLSAARKRLYERVEHINRAWLDSMREMRRAEAEFSIRLFSRNSADAALALCDQWLAKRNEIIQAERSAFDKAWPELLEAVKNPRALKRREQSGTDRNDEI
jgi:hypothetical protein